MRILKVVTSSNEEMVCMNIVLPSKTSIQESNGFHVRESWMGI